MFEQLASMYDRRPILIRAVIWGVLVFVSGVALDLTFYHLHWSRIWERIVENAIEGFFMIFVAYIILKKREARLKRRFHEIGYLNHHIRNALSVIEYVASQQEVGNQREMLRACSARIQRSLEKVSRNEDLSDINRTPSKID